MMQQPNKSPPIAEREVRATEIVSMAELLASFTKFVRRQFPTILFVVLLASALGVVYLFTTPPAYTAQATMIIDTRKVQIQQTLFGDALIDTGMVDSQVEILMSENIRLAVIKELHLAEDPEFVGRAGGLVGALINLIADFMGAGAPKSEFELMHRAAEVFASRLTVQRVGMTYIIQIGFRSLNPDRAAQVANATADAYIVDQLKAKVQATRRAGAWLQDRIRELREQASTAQRAMVEFKTNNNIVSTGTDGRLMDEQRVAEVNSQLVTARAQTSEARARLDRIEAVLGAESPSVTVEATVADSLKNEVITKLRTRYVEMANRVADWSARYGRDHLAAVNFRNQMREIRNSIVDELRRIAETYKSDYEIAKQREEDMQKELAQAVLQFQSTNKAQVTLRELDSNAQAYRALYDNFQQRYMESVQQQSFPITEARVVTPAYRPLRKSDPKTLVLLAVTGLGGLISALGIARLRELSSRVFRTAAQVEASLQKDCLAVLPRITTGQVKGRSSGGKITESVNEQSKEMNEGPFGLRTIVRDNSMVWHVVNSPLSGFTESMRSIKVAVDNGADRPNKVIGITSTLPDEGKSTIAGCLAHLMSHAGARTILVDCDLRKPSLTRALAPRSKLGIADVISGNSLLNEVIWNDQASGLTFLPAAMSKRLADSSEILGSDAAKKLFDKLRENYDYVVVDLSPLAPIVDVRATTRLVDSYIFVVEWGGTKFDAVEKVLNGARGIYENMLGVVLNKADIKVLSRYEGCGYNARYGYLYGMTDVLANGANRSGNGP